jgi:hypothetical protein
VSEANPKKMAASATQAASAEAGKEPLEFGGWPGAIGLIVFSHFIVYYTFTALEEKKGALFWDMSLMLKTIVTKAAPTVESVTIYGAFILLEAILAAVLPGFKTQGLPIPHLKNKSLAYNCNAYFAWWVTLAVIGTLHFTGTLRLGRIATLRELNLQFLPLRRTAFSLDAPHALDALYGPSSASAREEALQVLAC